MSRRAPRSGPPRAFQMRTAGAALGDVLQLRGISDEIRANRVLSEWSDLVGAKIAARTRPWGVTDRVLVIEVATSAWMHELNLLKNQILTGLLARIGEPRLFDELRFKLAGRSRAPQGDPRRTAAVGRRAPAPPRPPAKPATGLAREQIIRDVERIDDDELRELIARVRIDNDR